MSRRRSRFVSTKHSEGVPDPFSAKRVLTPFSVDLALDAQLAKDCGGDLFDRLGGGVDGAHAFAAHEVFSGLDFEAAVVDVGVAAAGAALLADLVQALGGDGEAVEAGLLGAPGSRQRFAAAIFRVPGVGGCVDG